MKKINLNLIPSQLDKGIINSQEAINLVCSFINENYHIFKLNKYDDDFKEEIILALLEKKDFFLSNYNPNQGDFQTYLYCYITSLIHTKLRSAAISNLKESITFNESINNIDDVEYSYTNINYNCFEVPKIPYSNKKINPQELKKTFERINEDKALLVVAMKSAFYLNDYQIKRICNHYNLQEEDFQKTIQYCKNQLLDKSDRKSKVQERRNYAYYHHKKYEKQLILAKQNDFKNKDIHFQNYISEKNHKQYSNWQKLNDKLEKGYIILRPTNKTVASILGICERQVSYYIKYVKNNFKNYIKQFELEDKIE